MKKIRIYSILFLLVFMGVTSSCDDGFTDLNKNKVSPTSLNPELVMNTAILNAVIQARGATICYYYPIAQQVLTPFGTSLSGGNYNQLNLANATATWSNYYPTVVKTIVDVIDQASKDDTKKNLLHAARIFKAYVFMVLTDTYGDIPYFEAGKGYIEGIVSPVYDSQQAIYDDLLKELEEASAALTTTLPMSANDILYGGDVNKWKRFGYSLMLRVAMRLSKVDAAKAQLYVGKAVAGGLMSTILDNAIVRHTTSYLNPVGVQLTGTERANYYLAKPFVEYLKGKNNPFLPSIGIRFVGATSATNMTPARASTDPAKQKGMPMGYDNVSIATQNAAEGVVSLYDYTQPNALSVVTATSPEFYVTHGQTQLLLAEAIVRGWVAGGNAAASTAFSNGVRAYLEQQSQYGTAEATIAAADITTYVTNNPLNTSSLEASLEQINTEYWVASFLNGPELFSNLRRTGYPVLAPNPYPGSEVPGEFIRRMVYPQGEYTVNLSNVQSAVSRQGADKISTRVWWDKP